MNENPHSPNTPDLLTGADTRERYEHILRDHFRAPLEEALSDHPTDALRWATGTNLTAEEAEARPTNYRVFEEQIDDEVERLENEQAILRLRQQLDTEPDDSEFVDLLERALDQRLKQAVSYNR